VGAARALVASIVWRAARRSAATPTVERQQEREEAAAPPPKQEKQEQSEQRQREWRLPRDEVAPAQGPQAIMAAEPQLPSFIAPKDPAAEPTTSAAGVRSPMARATSDFAAGAPTVHPNSSVAPAYPGVQGRLTELRRSFSALKQSHSLLHKKVRHLSRGVAEVRQNTDEGSRLLRRLR